MRALSQQDLVSRLEDELFRLREQHGADRFPRSAAEYLDEWASDEKRWLRKYYPPEGDEPHFDLTPATEKAIEWLSHLAQRPLVATESRLLTVLELLRQLTDGTERDPEAVVAELMKRRAALDAEIERARSGRLDVMDAARVKDRFLAMAATARALLADFREVDQSFRDLDRAVRGRISQWEGGKGALLEKFFGEREAIGESDQGKSFRAFWDFLMSPARQEELTSRLEKVFALPAVRELSPDRRLLHVHYDWLEAGEITQRTIARLSDQLRRYLDDLAAQENRRIRQLIRQVEQHAVAVRDAPPQVALAYIDELAPEINLPMERPLHAPALKPRIANQIVLDGDQDIDAEALFAQVHVDRARLRAHIDRVLQARQQVTLAELVEGQALTQGLAELVAYLTLASEDRRAVVSDDSRQSLEWDEPSGARRRATLPMIVFTR